MKPKITVLDAFTLLRDDIAEWKTLESLCEVSLYDRTAPADVIERCKDSDMVLTNKVVLDKEVLSALPKLRYVGVLATGYNVVDTEYAAAHGITVTNIPAYSTDSVAQMVFAHLLHVVNNIAYYNEQNHKGRWCYSPDMCYLDFPLHELSSLSIGIVGLGHIGMRVAAIAHAFGMAVYAYTSKSVTELPPYVRKCELREIYQCADVITLHCPLNSSTEKMINSNTLQLMKREAIVINTGRGGLVDEIALAAALSERRIQAYCTDVLSTEPPRIDNPLLSVENAYITPHIGWSAIEPRRRLMAIAEDNIRSFLNGMPINVVK